MSQIKNILTIKEEYKNLVIDSNGNVDFNILKPLKNEENSKNCWDCWGCYSNAKTIKDVIYNPSLEDGIFKVCFETTNCEPTFWIDEFRKRGIDCKLEVYEPNKYNQKTLELNIKDGKSECKIFDIPMEYEEEMEK